MRTFKLSRKANIMKAKKQAVAQEQPVLDAIPVEPKTWMVNCPKCGASLNLKEGGYAYMCPVCNTLLRIKTGARLVKQVEENKKNVHVLFTERAIKLLQWSESEKQFSKKAKKAEMVLWTERAISVLALGFMENNKNMSKRAAVAKAKKIVKQAKKRPDFNPGILEELLAKHATGYAVEESILVDFNENGFDVRKA